MEKKKTNCSVIIVIILMLMVLGLGGYITYDKILSNNDSSKTTGNNDKGSEKQENIVVTQDDVDKLMERVNNIPNFEELDITKLKSLTNQQKLWVALKIGSGLKGKDIKDALIKYYGTDLDVKLEDILCTVENKPLYIYNEKTDAYSFNENHPGHGSGFIGGSNSLNYFNSYEIKDNIVKIEVKKIFDSSAGNDINSSGCYGYYKSYKDSIDRKNEVKTNSKYCTKTGENDYECSCDAIYKGEKDTLETYIYVFEKQNGNYIFKNYSIKK